MKAPEYVQGTPNWIDLATPDPDGAKAFYTKLFGWTYDDVPTDQGAPYIMIHKDGEVVAGLSKGPDDFPTVWSTYIAVDDVEASTEKAVAAGGSVMMPVMDAMGTGLMSFVTDPGGAFVGFWQAKTHKGASVVNEPNYWTWSELMTTDIEGSKAFYQAVLGIEGHTQDMGGMEYTTWIAGGRAVGGMMKTPMEGIPNHWHTYFATDDVDGTCELITANGGAIHAGPMDISIGRMATVADPWGAAFSVISMPEWPTA